MATKPVDTPINPAYIAGQVMNCAAYIGARPPVLSLLETSKMPEGRRSIDAAYLRCQFLLQPQGGLTPVLSMDRWPDCEMAPRDPFQVRADALKEAGSVKVDTGFVQNILVALDDKVEEGRSDGGLSGFLALVFDPPNWPLQGTTGRSLVETTIQLTDEIVNVIKDIIVEAFPATKSYANNGQRLIRIFIDLMRFIGDYLGEYYNVWQVQNARLYSMQRKANIDGKYAAVYGAKPSSATLRSWCSYGKERGDGGIAPDGTTTAYDFDSAVWRSTQAAAQTQIPAVSARFGNDFARFYAANVILAGWYGGYDNLRGLYSGDATTYTEGVTTHSLAYAILIGATQNRWSKKVWLLQPDIFRRPTTADEWASTIRIPSDSFLVPDTYFIPFWEATALGLYNQPNSIGFTTDQRVEFKRMAKFAAWNTYRNATINDFAKDMLVVWNMWDAASMGANLTVGKKKRDRWIKKQLTDNIQHFQEQLDFLATVQPGFQQNFTTWQVAISDVLSAADPAPDPLDKKYGGVKGSCPDPLNPNSTACLPCAAIKARRPVGAVPIDVPMALTWTGNRGRFNSPEFAAWKRRLTESGYPDYYVDCLARDVTFTAGPGASDEPVKPCPIGYTRTPSGQCIGILRPGTPLREISGRYLGPLSGADLSSRVLRGITRPVVAELAGPTLPRRR